MQIIGSCVHIHSLHFFFKGTGSAYIAVNKIVQAFVFHFIFPFLGLGCLGKFTYSHMIKLDNPGSDFMLLSS